MPIPMSAVAVGSFEQTLGALSKILDKAVAHCTAKKIDPAVLLQTRLTPDMFPLVRQVQLACDFAKNCVGRLTGEPPKFRRRGKDLRGAQGAHRQDARLHPGFKAADIDATADKDVTFPIGPQQTMTLKGEQFWSRFVLPNFYFHATTAYDILRQCGSRSASGISSDGRRRVDLPPGEQSVTS